MSAETHQPIFQKIHQELGNTENNVVGSLWKWEEKWRINVTNKKKLFPFFFKAATLKLEQLRLFTISDQIFQATFDHLSIKPSYCSC